MNYIPDVHQYLIIYLVLFLFVLNQLNRLLNPSSYFFKTFGSVKTLPPSFGTQGVEPLPHAESQNKPINGSTLNYVRSKKTYRYYPLFVSSRQVRKGKTEEESRKGNVQVKKKSCLNFSLNNTKTNKTPRSRADPKSKNSPMIPKEKLTRKTSSGKTTSSEYQPHFTSLKNLDPKRSTSEYDAKYEFCQAGSSASFHQQRILHKETEQLAATSSKRHLSSASFSTGTEPRHHDFAKPASRKTAFGKHEHAELNVKEETDRLLGLSCAGKRQKRPDEPKCSAIITTSSWRIGENLAQKHMKPEPDKTMPAHPYQVQYNPRSNSAPVNQSPHAPKKTKRTECHLVASVAPKKPAVTSPQANKSKSKPYDLNDIQKYIQSQKSKRLHDTKSEKEKQKMQDEERKKKLQELYRKQRLQALKSAQIASTSKLNNSSEKANSSNNSSKLYDQDMSKILMERISHLLNDNDKLVEKQRKQMVSEKHKARKKVDFGTEEADMDHDMEQNESSTSSASLGTVNNSVSVTPKQNNGKTSLKHDRLKKICSMALDLQTKLQQTKLKLFGFNPTDDEDMIEYYKKSDNDTFVTSTKNEHEEAEDGPEMDAIQLDRVFKQDVRETRGDGGHEEMEVSGEDVWRPGVGSLRSYRLVLTPDLAARRIQHAYRLYRARRKTQRAPKRLKKENVRPPPPPPPPPMLKGEQTMGLNSQKDGYSFFSVYRKKGGFGAAVSANVAPLHPASAKTKQESNNYADEFMTFNETKGGEVDRLSTIKSSLSSSSDSTSLSKAIASSDDKNNIKKNLTIDPSDYKNNIKKKIKAIASSDHKNNIKKKLSKKDATKYVALYCEFLFNSFLKFTIPKKLSDLRF
ncbi:hypothetical protein BpHYR1_013387 [Brachionus plicatilis]|uniref:Uncharacterized protein n=1 Tax=Brachionus plicatilis TaxID=10195 RepID=A0A3M7T2G1_BRAPC|nr:hypothetical protein BpHYR1_013387 [Brachionus plicatilis]